MIKDQALAGKIALVTGGSRGIGRAVAIALAARGARVVVNYQTREDAARAVADEIGGSVLGFDCGGSEAIDAAVKQIIVDHGRLDIVVNNAGIAIDGLILRVKPADWERSLAVNLGGAFAVCRAAGRHLLKAKDGRIINVTSVVGEMGNAGQSAYAAAKAGLIGLTKSLAREFASRGVTVNAVSPGFIETDMTAAHLQGEAREKLIADIPLARIGRADEVADAVAFLAGPEAAYITGQLIRVNGGLLM